MKLRYLLPFYALLIAVSFCCRKISSEKEEAEKNEKTLKSFAAPPQSITGTLQLDKRTNIIYADLWIGVSNPDFKFTNDIMPLQTDSLYKGISFRYYDVINNSADTENDTIPLHVVFNFANTNRWVENDSIRVMSLNEDKQSDFEGLKPYFEARMDHFKNVPAAYSALVDFNDSWNTQNPDNKVTTGNPSAKNTKKFFIPRRTRDDSILSLTLKK